MNIVIIHNTIKNGIWSVVLTALTNCVKEHVLLETVSVFTGEFINFPATTFELLPTEK